MDSEEFKREVLDKLVELTTTTKGIAERIQRHDIAIFGNGQPGLKERMTLAESHLGELKGTEANAKSAKQAAKASVAGLIGTAMMALGAAIASALGLGK